MLMRCYAVSKASAKVFVVRVRAGKNESEGERSETAWVISHNLAMGILRMHEAKYDRSGPGVVLIPKVFPFST